MSELVQEVLDVLLSGMADGICIALLIKSIAESDMINIAWLSIALAIWAFLSVLNIRCFMKKRIIVCNVMNIEVVNE